MLSSLQREILFLHNYIELKYSLRSLESSSSSLTTTTPVNTSHNSSWDEVRTQYIKLYIYLIYMMYYIFINLPSPSPPLWPCKAAGGRVSSLFVVIAGAARLPATWTPSTTSHLQTSHSGRGSAWRNSSDCHQQPFIYINRSIYFYMITSISFLTSNRNRKKLNSFALEMK